MIWKSPSREENTKYLQLAIERWDLENVAVNWLADVKWHFQSGMF